MLPFKSSLVSTCLSLICRLFGSEKNKFIQTRGQNWWVWIKVVMWTTSLACSLLSLCQLGLNFSFGSQSCCTATVWPDGTFLVVLKEIKEIHFSILSSLLLHLILYSYYLVSVPRMYRLFFEGSNDSTVITWKVSLHYPECKFVPFYCSVPVYRFHTGSFWSLKHPDGQHILIDRNI